MIGFLRKWWCGLTHGGGDITRDHLGRINWRCRSCGRWSDYPVPREDEDARIEKELAEWRARREAKADQG